MRHPLDWLLRLAVPKDDRPAVLGDLSEEYERRVRPQRNWLGAQAWYLGQLCAAVGFALIGRVRHSNRAVVRFRLEAVRQDLRYGARSLSKSPGFTAVTILTLALGIGANTAVFGVVDAVLFRPLPFRAPDQLVRVVSMRLDSHTSGSVSYPDFADWRARNHVFTGLSAFCTDSFTLSGRGDAVHVPGAIVSANLFSLLGVRPALGRGFLPADDRLGGTNGGFVIILSHRLWVEQFGADPRIVNQAIDIDNRPFTVIGVMPADVQFPVQAGTVDFWTTMAVEFVSAPGTPAVADERGGHFLEVIARLAPHVTLDQAQQEMVAMASTLNREYPEVFPRTVRLVPEVDAAAGPARPILWVLLGAVGCVLLITCANVASLFLARAAGRQREMAVRGALGAARTRLVRQLLVESLMIAALGGAVGSALALWGFHVAAALAADRIPRLAQAQFTVPMLLFTLGLSTITGVLTGLMPALQTSRLNIIDALKHGGRASGNWRSRRARSALVVTDVAISTVLLVGAGLLVQSLWRVQHVDPGFNPDHVLTFKIDLPYVRYSGAAQSQFFRRAMSKLGELPGVQSVSAALPLPLDSADEAWVKFDIERKPTSVLDRPTTQYTWVEPGYFRTLEIPLVGGRDFNAEDDLSTAPVVIVNETLAKRFFPDGHVIGARIRPGISTGYATAPMRQIVGVAGNVRSQELMSSPDPQVYVPVAQSPVGSLLFAIRTVSDPSGLVPAVRHEVAAMDRGLPIYQVMPLDQYVGDSIAAQRVVAPVLSLFATVALALTLIGLYGVVAYSVAQRTQEIGMRMALGARRQQVLALVLGHGFRLTAIGLAIGIAGALALTGLLTSLLYGVGSTDPLTFAAVVMGFVVVALLASYAPARRAAGLDPMAALRIE